jgi:hypothetical protein
MTKKNNPLDDYQKIKNEMVVDAVNEIFRKHPDKSIQKLEEIGFKYHEEDDTEQIEEDNAVPENDRQKFLVSYFEGENELSEKALKAYLEERESDHPNYPLIRKYFKKANPHLKSLLLFGLDQTSTSMDLLSDLAYFHEFSNILDELVNRFISACQQELDILNFSEMIQDFYYSTEPDGYVAFTRLKELFPLDTEKGKTVEFFSAELMRQKKEPYDIEL